MKRFLILALFGMPLHAETAPSSYDAVMRAQYAARGTPAPLGAAEAKRIYDAYLNGLGKSAPVSNSSYSGEGAGMSTH